jgi:hypothetical protein
VQPPKGAGGGFEPPRSGTGAGRAAGRRWCVHARAPCRARRRLPLAGRAATTHTVRNLRPILSPRPQTRPQALLLAWFDLPLPVDAAVAAGPTPEALPRADASSADDDAPFFEAAFDAPFDEPPFDAPPFDTPPFDAPSDAPPYDAPPHDAAPGPEDEDEAFDFDNAVAAPGGSAPYGGAYQDDYGADDAFASALAAAADAAGLTPPPASRRLRGAGAGRRLLKNGADDAGGDDSVNGNANSGNGNSGNGNSGNGNSGKGNSGNGNSGSSDDGGAGDDSSGAFASARELARAAAELIFGVPPPTAAEPAAPPPPAKKAPKQENKAPARKEDKAQSAHSSPAPMPPPADDSAPAPPAPEAAASGPPPPPPAARPAPPASAAERQAAAEVAAAMQRARAAPTGSDESKAAWTQAASEAENWVTVSILLRGEGGGAAGGLRRAGCGLGRSRR